MSILEDLDLMDLPDILPDNLDFDLDDILFEYRTPGHYADNAEELIPPSVQDSVPAEKPRLVFDVKPTSVFAKSEPAEEILEEPVETEPVPEFDAPASVAAQESPADSSIQEPVEEPEQALPKQESVSEPEAPKAPPAPDRKKRQNKHRGKKKPAEPTPVQQPRTDPRREIDYRALFTDDGSELSVLLEAELYAKLEEKQAARLAEEAEARRLAEEAEALRLAEEAEARRLAEEAEIRRLVEEAETRRLAEEAEARRLAEEAEARRLAEEAEALRLAEEAEARRLAEEAEALRLAEEAEARRLAEEAEALRLAEEAEAQRLAELEAEWELEYLAMQQEKSGISHLDELFSEEEAVPATESNSASQQEHTMLFDAIALPHAEEEVSTEENDTLDQAVDIMLQDTLHFDAIPDITAASVAQAQPVTPAQPTQKKPGLLQRLAALLPKKKAAKPAAPAESPIEPVSQNETLSDSAEAPAVFYDSDAAVLMSTDVMDAAATELTEEIPAAVEEEPTVFYDSDDELSFLLDLELHAAMEAAPISEEEQVVAATEDSFHETTVSMEEIASDTVTAETEADDNLSAEYAEKTISYGDPFGLDDLLSECDTFPDTEEMVHAETFVDAEPDMMEATLQFDAPALIPEEEQTLLFDTISVSEPEQPPVPAADSNKKTNPIMGFVQRLAALLPKKKAAAPVSTVQIPAPEAPVVPSVMFDGADDELSVLLEAELFAAIAAEEEARQAELDAQLAAEEEARIAAEEEARLAAEAEAERLAQQQAEILAQQQAEAELEAMSENELFAWIETSSGYRKRQQLEEEQAILQEALAYEAAAAEAEEIPAEAEPEYAPPVYDAEAAFAEELPETKDVFAPQLDYDLAEEEASDDAALLLETPDIDPEPKDTFSETPEEMAARIAREDDELHYVPEDPPLKVILNAISSRFSGLFAAFTQQGSDEDSDHEEDLGPEVAPQKAYRHYSRHISGYRFRLHVSAALCVIIAWISLGLPVLGSLKNPAVAAAMCLMILLTVMLTGADILTVGIRNLMQKRPGLQSLVALSAAASIIDAIVIIITKGKAGYLPFCGVSALSICFSIYGSLLYCRSQRLNFKTLELSAEPMTISVDYGIVEAETTTAYRSPGHPEGYIHRSEEEDLSETVYGIITPVLMLAVPVLSLLAALVAKSIGDVFHIMAGMFSAAASFSAMMAFPLPYFLVQRDLYAAKAGIAGWTGTREIGRVSTMIVNDRDLFPDETVSIKSIGIVDNVPPQLTLSYACSLIKQSGSCLVPAFLQLADNHDCELYDVENFECHEAGGLSCEIGPDHVLLASHSYMKLQGLRLPIPRKKSENSLFLAVNGHVIAYFTMEYKAIKSVRYGLDSALRGAVEIIFAARDFNITPLLISQKFRCETDTIRFPSYKQRYEITSKGDSETATCAAVVYRKSFFSYAMVVEKARYLYRSVTWSVILSVVSSVMGVLLEFFMALIGAGAAITVGRLLVFMLLWLVPTLAISVSITK